MNRTAAIALVVAAGVVIAMQAPVNGRLGRQIGTLQAATVSFLVGTAALVAITAAFGDGGIGAISGAHRAPWWALIGGLLGAFYVAVALLTVRTLGATVLTALVVSSQLVTALLLDRLGLFGLTQRHPTPLQLAGVVLLMAGTVLVIRP
ncbi:MAG TPA: DMT family transporter [Solirubrobacteraceae bacterium]|nr:DMT family transporter [Solirubrobacteraceae bacterium]